jgi:hypothetical protein
MAVTLFNLWDEPAGNKQKVIGPVSGDAPGLGLCF